MRQFQTSATRQDIDQAAKYIGAGAATVGVAGSGTCLQALLCLSMRWIPLVIRPCLHVTYLGRVLDSAVIV